MDILDLRAAVEQVDRGDPAYLFSVS